MLVDTHTHVQFRGFKGEADKVMNRALAEGITVINVGTQKDTSKEAVEMLALYSKNVYAVVGLHPLHTFSQYVDEEESHFLTREEIFDYEYYKVLAQNDRVVGIGECGLDYYRLPADLENTEIKKRQLATFEAQIKLVLELNKVLCVHTRPSQGTQDAYRDLYEILRVAKIENANLRFEVHCYTGDVEHALKFVELGGFIGVNGILTFDKTGVSAEVVKNIPLEKILLETDAPYLTPIPFRGKRNEPLYVKHVAEKVAEVKGVTLAKVAEITTQNAVELFELNYEH